MIEQLVQIQSELERMNTENQRLREMVSHVTSNYAALQMHIVTLMQQQIDARAQTTPEHDKVKSFNSMI